MKKIIIQSAFALALIGSTFVYAQNDIATIEPVAVISSNPADAMPVKKCEVPGVKLGLGDGSRNKRSAEVKKLQEYLTLRGYLSTTTTGYFGPLTLSAVKKFQKEEGINATGYVGPLTLERIKNKCSTTPTIVCEYAAPPEDCTYIAGPNYNKQTQCGMVLSCGDTISYEPPTNCKSWYDGCNTCARSTPGGSAFCTKRACINNGDNGASIAAQGKCNIYFETNTAKTCTAFGIVYTEGQNTNCIDDGHGNKACIADATHVCRGGIWKIEGSYPGIYEPPVACTLEARLCPNGSLMPRDSKCGWHPEQCIN